MVLKRLWFIPVSRFGPVPLFATLWTVARQAPLSMGFSRQEYWSGLPCPAPGDLPDPGIELVSLMSTCISRQVLYCQRHLGSPKETLTLTKFQGIYLSKAFLDFEADVKERAYGTEGGKKKKILAYKPEDKQLSLTLITDLNMLCN